MVQSKSAPLWYWPNILSLDTAVIAIVWQYLVARSLHIEIDIYQSIVLGLSIWLVYVADRFVDGYHLEYNKNKISYRHSFCINHRRTIFVIWLLVLTINLYLAHSKLSLIHLLSGYGLLFFCLIYFIVNQVLKSSSQRYKFPKEILVATIFSLGIFVFLIDLNQLNYWDFLKSYVPILLLCLLNCFYISVWEFNSEIKQEQNFHSFNKTVRTKLSNIIAIINIVLSYLLILDSKNIYGQFLGIALIISTLSLLLLNNYKYHFENETLHVLGDYILMSPVLFILSESIIHKMLLI